MDTIIVPVLKTRKLRLGEVKWLAQGHAAREWWSQRLLGRDLCLSALPRCHPEVLCLVKGPCGAGVQGGAISCCRALGSSESRRLQEWAGPQHG